MKGSCSEVGEIEPIQGEWRRCSQETGQQDGEHSDEALTLQVDREEDGGKEGEQRRQPPGEGEARSCGRINTTAGTGGHGQGGVAQANTDGTSN